MLPKPGLLLWFWIESPIVTVIQWVLLIGPIRFCYRRLTRPFAKTDPGEILELGYSNHFAAFYLSSYVDVLCRGRRVHLRLTRWQAVDFARNHFEGEMGLLTYYGSRLVRWQPTEGNVAALSPEPRPKAFLSFAHAWRDDARWVADVFRGKGIDVWIDETGLDHGDRIADEIEKHIATADCIVPFLSPEYVTSTWCVREFDHAIEERLRVYPIKVVPGELRFPPHLRDAFRKLGDPLYLDLRKKGALAKLHALADRIVAEFRSRRLGPDGSGAGRADAG